MDKDITSESTQESGSDSTVTYYESLGVLETSSEEEIRMTFYRLTLDLSPESSDYQALREMFVVLTNPAQRKKYDQELALQRSSPDQVWVGLKIENIKEFEARRNALRRNFDRRMKRLLLKFENEDLSDEELLSVMERHEEWYQAELEILKQEYCVELEAIQNPVRRRLEAR